MTAYSREKRKEVLDILDRDNENQKLQQEEIQRKEEEMRRQADRQREANVRYELSEALRLKPEENEKKL